MFLSTTFVTSQTSNVIDTSNYIISFCCRCESAQCFALMLNLLNAITFQDARALLCLACIASHEERP